MGVAALNMNHYEILKIPVAYDIDKGLLTENYFSLQRDLGQVNLEILNEAYNVLKSDIKRGEYFLSLKNVSVERISTDLAVKMFEMRETYESLEEDEKVKFLKQTKKKTKDLASELKENEGDLDKFVEIFSELKFLSSFLEKERSDVYSRN